jgi:DNA-3-methyladenine glycosylase II
MTTVAEALASTRVELTAPLDIPGSVLGLGRWGDDGSDRWDGRRILRTARLDGAAVPYRAVPVGCLDVPALEVTAPEGRLDQVAEAVRGSFVYAGDSLCDLIARDPAVARADARFPGVRPLLHRDPLTALVRSISAQQINLRWAAVIRRRLAERYGTRLQLDGEPVWSLGAAALASADPEDLRALQFTYRKGLSIVAVARWVLEGRLERAELDRLEDEAVVEHLVRLPGIGRWSAEWFLARTLGRPVVVAGDLGVRKAIGLAYLDGRMPSEAEVRSMTAHWGRTAGVAQQLLLHALNAP